MLYKYKAIDLKHIYSYSENPTTLQLQATMVMQRLKVRCPWINQYTSVYGLVEIGQLLIHDSMWNSRKCKSHLQNTHKHSTEGSIVGPFFTQQSSWCMYHRRLHHSDKIHIMQKNKNKIKQNKTKRTSGSQNQTENETWNSLHSSKKYGKNNTK